MNIKPNEQSLEKILTGIETKYKVPLYQRDYSWKKDNVEELWTDLLTSFENTPESEYFMGTIVLNKEGLPDDTYDIIDGQQRLATFCVLFSVIHSFSNSFPTNYKLFEELERNDSNKKIALKIADISKQTLMHSSEPDNYYLVLNKKDNELFENKILKNFSPLFLDEDLQIVTNDARIVKTKKIFSKKIFDIFSKNTNGLFKLKKFLMYILKKIKFITIVVESDYDAYLLFESLNSKGLDLSEADLIKNKLMMACNSNENLQKKILSKWEQMCDNLIDSRFSIVEYIRFYWIAFYNADITKKELYKAVKKNIDNNSIEIEGFMNNLLEESGFFSTITSKSLSFPSLNNEANYKIYSELNYLNYSICYPVILYCNKNRENLSTYIALKFLNILFRMITIMDYSVGKASELNKKILKLLKENSSEEEIKQEFINYESEISNEKFKESFRSFNTETNKIAKYILIKIHIKQEGRELLPNINEIHLEHILPIESKLWDSSDFNNDFKYWKYRIGNMTLIDKTINMSIKNAKFPAKLEYYQEKTDSSEIGTKIPMTYKIFNDNKDDQKWTNVHIDKRQEEFSNIVADVWSL